MLNSFYWEYKIKTKNISVTFFVLKRLKILQILHQSIDHVRPPPPLHTSLESVLEKGWEVFANCGFAPNSVIEWIRVMEVCSNPSSGQRSSFSGLLALWGSNKWSCPSALCQEFLMISSYSISEFVLQLCRSHFLSVFVTHVSLCQLLSLEAGGDLYSWWLHSL